MTKALSYKRLMGVLRESFERLPDYRTGQNSQYEVADAAAGGFGVFFTQSPSFLAYQRDMQRRKGRNNAQSLFGARKIPSDVQIRNLLDPIDPAHLRAPFWEILDRLECAQQLEAYRYAGMLLCSLDGTQYFRSTQIHCAQCTVMMRKGNPQYAHTALLPAVVKPGQSAVIALEPEFIVPQDGAKKQDCERKAARRWVLRNAHHLAPRGVTILADDLYCNQPFCQLLLEQGLNFILTCKPDSHSALYEEVALLGKIDAVQRKEKRHWNGREYERWIYRYVEQVPLRADVKPLWVNWCELRIVRESSGEVLYHSAWATNHLITEENVAEIVSAARSRWKIENENNNVLKNHGYHLEHNYGHGQEHLSTVLVTLLLLAFLIHTVLHLWDDQYRRLRQELGARQTFFDDIRALTRYLFFESWDSLLCFMLRQLELEPE